MTDDIWFDLISFFWRQPLSSIWPPHQWQILTTNQAVSSQIFNFHKHSPTTSLSLVLWSQIKAEVFNCNVHVIIIKLMNQLTLCMLPHVLHYSVLWGNNQTLRVHTPTNNNLSKKIEMHTSLLQEYIIVVSSGGWGVRGYVPNSKTDEYQNQFNITALYLNESKTIKAPF